MKTLHDLLRSFASLAILMTTAGFASAATINWGDFSDPEGSVTFVDVSEDNDEDSTVFDGEDGPDVMGNMLIFDPQGFQSQASNGSDLIDSELSFMVVPQEPTWIETIRIEEFGDYTLGGLSNGEAIASVGAVFFWTINEVDGEPVSLPMQVTQLDVSGGGMYVRPDNDGTAQPWTGYAELNDPLRELGRRGDDHGDLRQHAANSGRQLQQRLHQEEGCEDHSRHGRYEDPRANHRHAGGVWYRRGFLASPRVGKRFKETSLDTTTPGGAYHGPSGVGVRGVSFTATRCSPPSRTTVRETTSPASRTPNTRRNVATSAVI